MRGQIFTLDLFVSLIIVVLVLSLTTVIIDRSIESRYDNLAQVKLNSIAMDLATYEYYNGNLPAIGGYMVCNGNSERAKACAVRGTGENEVKVCVCK